MEQIEGKLIEKTLEFFTLAAEQVEKEGEQTYNRLEVAKMLRTLSDQIKDELEEIKGDSAVNLKLFTLKDMRRAIMQYLDNVDLDDFASISLDGRELEVNFEYTKFRHNAEREIINNLF